MLTGTLQKIQISRSLPGSTKPKFPESELRPVYFIKYPS